MAVGAGIGPATALVLALAARQGGGPAGLPIGVGPAPGVRPVRPPGLPPFGMGGRRVPRTQTPGIPMPRGDVHTPTVIRPLGSTGVLQNALAGGMRR